MRGMWKGLGCLGAVLLALAGCKPTESRIQPPPLREEFTLPPDDDSRYGTPPNFPKEAKNGTQRKPTDGTQPPPSMRGGGPGGRIGGGPGGPGGRF